MKYIYSFLFRILLCFMPMWIFSIILAPITVYACYFLVLSFGAVLNGAVLTIGNYEFEFIDACIGIAAYYFLWILAMLVKDVTVRMRAKIVLLSFLMLFLGNIVRIALLMIITFWFGVDVFYIIHMVWWKLISGIYVAIVWIAVVKYFNAESIPAYDDLRYLWKIAKKN